MLTKKQKCLGHQQNVSEQNGFEVSTSKAMPTKDMRRDDEDNAGYENDKGAQTAASKWARENRRRRPRLWRK